MFVHFIEMFTQHNTSSLKLSVHLMKLQKLLVLILRDLGKNRARFRPIVIHHLIVGSAHCLHWMWASR